MTIEERFERLEKENRELREKVEKQNRRLRRLSLASIALALAALIGGTALSVRAYTAAIDPASITTQAIYLKDSSGRTRLSLLGSSGLIMVYDTNSAARASISVGQIQVLDSNAVTRVYLSATENKIFFRNASGQIVKTLP